MSHHPTTGARFLLERLGASDDRAEYAATIYTPDAAFTYKLALAVGEPPAVDPGADRAPEALEARLVAIAKTIVAKAPKRQAQEPITWPRRVLRWKNTT